MGQKEKARRLLARYLRQKTNAEETGQVERWYASYEKTPAGLSAEKREQLQADIYRNISAHIDAAKPRPVVYNMFKPAIQIAATLLLVSSLALIFFKNRVNPESAILHMVKTGATEQKRILLGDGTEIWLKPATTLAYTGDLKQGDRNVELIGGSAFFKVHHEASRPFRVKMPAHLFTQVLGTSFMISAPNKNEDMLVAVKSGKVAVGKDQKIFGLFTAGQQLTYHAAGQRAEAGTIHPVLKTMHFDHTTLAQLATELEWTYYVHINIPKDKHITTLQCTGTFDSNQDLADILKTVCLLHQLRLNYNPDLQTYKITKP